MTVQCARWFFQILKLTKICSRLTRNIFKIVNKKSSLKICTNKFIRLIISMERIVLYFLDNHIEVYGFIESLRHTLLKNVVPDIFCCAEMNNFLLEYYIKARCFQSEKQLNSIFVKRTQSKEKMRTFEHT